MLFVGVLVVHARRIKYLKAIRAPTRFLVARAQTYLTGLNGPPPSIFGKLTISGESMVLPLSRERVRIFGKLTISGESMVLPTDESCSDDVVCCRMLNLSVNRPQLLIPSRCPHSVT